ncbi:hypothetical protein AA0312_0841 [Acetobacter tropicalis NRIC 0312]|nr:hypothetical protein ATR1_451d0023 [Acetobacter tropicalis]GBR68294.1 hypothetical protein AA0312_0841 [Acetobacter tropicalis NRIC 0312]
MGFENTPDQSIENHQAHDVWQSGLRTPKAACAFTLTMQKTIHFAEEPTP